MSDSGSPGGRPFRSSSHSNLDPANFMSPVHTNVNNFNSQGLAHRISGTHQKMHENSDISFADIHNQAAQQLNNKFYRRHKTPQELSAGVPGMLGAPNKSSSHMKMQKQREIQVMKYPIGNVNNSNLFNQQMIGTNNNQNATGSFSQQRPGDRTNDTFHQANKNIPPGSLMTVQNDMQLFSNMPGLGPVNIGTEEWNLAKAKQHRMNLYASKLNQLNKSGGSKYSAFSEMSKNII